MKRIAFFVEGQTEQVFIEKLLIEMAGHKDIEIELKKFRGHNNPTATLRSIHTEPQSPKFGALIYDCAGEEQVRSKIQENDNPNFWSKYEKAIGLRDLYPKALADLPRLKQGLAYGLPPKARMVVAVREVEAWFIAECSHFQDLDPSLTPHKVKDKLGTDPCHGDGTQIEHPAESLKQVYLSGERRYSYNKSKRSVQRTVNHLNYSRMYLNVSSRMDALRELIQEIEDFLA